MNVQPTQGGPGCAAAVQVGLSLQALSTQSTTNATAFVRVRSVSGNTSIVNVSCTGGVIANAMPFQELVKISVSTARSGNMSVACTVITA